MRNRIYDARLQPLVKNDQNDQDGVRVPAFFFFVFFFVFFFCFSVFFGAICAVLTECSFLYVQD